MKAKVRFRFQLDKYANDRQTGFSATVYSASRAKSVKTLVPCIIKISPPSAIYLCVRRSSVAILKVGSLARISSP